MSKKEFDMIVIGAGPGGYVSAIRGAQLGLNVAIIEKEHMGGICLNWGCIPTKAMLRSSEVFDLVKKAEKYGISVGKVDYDLNSIIKRSRDIGAKLSGGITHLLNKNNITSILGEATLKPKTCVEVKTKSENIELLSNNIVLATGARAREIKGLEADGDAIWTYRDALTPKRMPKKLLVIGSGAIGIEFGSFYNTMGADTTIIEVLDRILPAEDKEIADLAKTQFLKQGMKIFEKSHVVKLTKGKKNLSVEIEIDGKISKLSFDTIISAVGIVGNVENLGLDEIGIEIKNSHVLVDEFCKTNVEGVFAIGDLAGAPWLAHKASHEGNMVAELIAGKSPHSLKPKSIAGCTYCSPQIASVGLTEDEVNEKGIEVKVGRFPFSANGKALAVGETEGMIKTIFDMNTGELLGAHMIGAEVTELIHGYVIGRTLEGTEEDFINSVFPHPTLSETMHESVLSAFDRAIHI